MADWQEIGKQLREKWLEDYRRRSERTVNQPPQRESDFTLALCQYARGDSSLLIECLISNRRFLASEREHLGRILERDTHRKRTGRRPHKNARIAAKVALIFYRQWQRANKQVGISNWGHGDGMKDEACRCAIETKPWLNGKEPDFESVRQLMERPNYRRNSK